MKRWLVSTGFLFALAVPAIARAQNPRDSVITDTTLTITETTTRTEVQLRADTVYQSGDTTVRRDLGPTLSSDTTRRDFAAPRDTTVVTTTPPTYAAQGYEEQDQDDDDHSQKGGFEIKGGLSWGNVSNRGVLPGQLNGRNGIALGIGMFGGSPVGFGIEGLYVQRGVENSVFDINSRRLDYIDVPGYLRLSVPLPFQPFVYAGPQVSFEVRCRAGSSLGAVNCPDTDRPTTSWAGIIGAGFRFNAGVALSLEGRYVYGLTDLHLSTITTAESYRTRSFMILLGIGM